MKLPVRLAYVAGHSLCYKTWLQPGYVCEAVVALDSRTESFVRSTATRAQVNHCMGGPHTSLQKGTLLMQYWLTGKPWLQCAGQLWGLLCIAWRCLEQPSCFRSSTMTVQRSLPGGFFSVCARSTCCWELQLKGRGGKDHLLCDVRAHMHIHVQDDKPSTACALIGKRFEPQRFKLCLRERFDCIKHSRRVKRGVQCRCTASYRDQLICGIRGSREVMRSFLV